MNRFNCCREIVSQKDYNIKSTYNSNTVLNPTNWVVNEVNILGSRCGPMDAALRIMERKLFSADGLIDEICSLKDYEKAFDRKAGKVIFDLKMD